MKILETKLSRIESMIDEIYAGTRSGSEMTNLEDQVRCLEVDIENAHRNTIKSEFRPMSL